MYNMFGERDMMTKKFTKIIEFVFIDDPHGMDLNNTNSMLEEIENTLNTNWQIPTIEKIRMLMPKDEAIAFAKKYLDVRKREDFVDKNHKHYEPFWTWRCAMDYVLNDIIPYLYGDALD